MSTASREVDILIVSDLRFPGGTSHSIATEIEAQARAGYTTGLIHLNGPLVRKVRGVNPAIAKLVRAGHAGLIVGPRPVTARIVVVRHPAVLQEAASRLPPISADQVVILANTGPRSNDGRVVYDVATTHRVARQFLGTDPQWAPIGPLVRAEIEHLVPAGHLMAEDWVNVIDVDAWWRPRPAWAADRPVVGRHSRPSAQKWPRDADTIEAVYPTDGSWVVRVLGGADPVEKVLGRVPRTWEELPFGSMSPIDFLARLDFFVYYHDPRWVEAFGRTILEAIASGAPAVLPPHFEALFGDAALYAEPSEVRRLVEGLRADRQAYDAHRRRAADLVRQRFSYATHARRIHGLIGAPSGTTHTVPQAARGARVSRTTDDRPRILLMSSNGAGMGHLTRLFSYAKRLEGAAAVHVLSMSQAAPVAGRLGHTFEYLPSAKALDMPPGRWRPMFVDRLGDTISRFGPEVVVFDGTWPYNGIEDVRRLAPEPCWVWSRRGMWREGLNIDQLHKSEWFDAVLEPGELAAPYDAGATVPEPAHRVGPVTLLDAADLLPRDLARRELGLPSEGRLALVSLGAGNINDTTGDLGAAVAALSRLGAGVCVTVPEIAAAGRTIATGVHLVRQYPLSRYYRAFDLVVSAAGYNSFHELLRLGVPTLFVPNTATSLDDQDARARFAVDQGWSHRLPELSVDAALPLLTDLLERGATMARAAQQADPGNGAPAAAQYLLALAEQVQR